ncbi:hypothetical protein GCM10027610_096430 [Dactylosporangium cerinum]
MELFDLAGDRFGKVFPLCGLGDLFVARGDRDAARETYAQALRISREMDANPRTAELEDRLSNL